MQGVANAVLILKWGDYLRYLENREVDVDEMSPEDLEDGFDRYLEEVY